MQANGIQFNAKDVFYKASDKKLNFSLDIANSYTESAGIISWNKEFTYLREESIIIEESYRLSRNESGIETSLMTCRKPEVKNGIILLPSYKSEDKNVKISYDHKLFDVVVEPFILEDAKLKSSWENGKLYRIVFTMKNKNLSGNINWKIELI